MFEIEFNQFTILKWWNMATGNALDHTISTSHHKGSRLIVDFFDFDGVSIQWAGNQSQVVLTGYETPEEKEEMFSIISQPTNPHP